MKTNNNILKYKGYFGSIEFSLQEKRLYGKILGIKGLYLYEGNTLDELEVDFKDFVDDYISSFEEKGQTAPKPNLGSLNVRLGMELHVRASGEAKRKKISLNKFIKTAVEHELHDYR